MENGFYSPFGHCETGEEEHNYYSTVHTKSIQNNGNLYNYLIFSVT